MTAHGVKVCGTRSGRSLKGKQRRKERSEGIDVEVNGKVTPFYQENVRMKMKSR